MVRGYIFSTFASIDDLYKQLYINIDSLLTPHINSDIFQAYKINIASMELSKYLTVKEVASTLKLNPLTIYEYIRKHRLSAVKFGRYYRVSLPDLLRFIESQKVV